MQDILPYHLVECMYVFFTCIDNLLSDFDVIFILLLHDFFLHIWIV